jgi:hypothetical protein
VRPGGPKLVNVYIVLRKSRARDADFHVAYVTWEQTRAHAFAAKMRADGCEAIVHTATLGAPNDKG